jgi:peptide/nickel transport system ATP-binding protein
MALLEVRDLHVSFRTLDGVVQAVAGVSFALERGRTLGLVGESGSGKSVSALTSLGLTRSRNAVIGGEVLLDGRNLLSLSEAEMRRIRGKRIAMIFQDPLSSLHPYYRIGAQITEAIRTHEDLSKQEARRRAIDALDAVGIPMAARRIDSYPHELSGGMRQRAMLAMALALRPDVLIADEPTTALDVTIQAQVLEVLKTVQAETSAATILITHDLGIVAELCDRVLVMYAGKIVEQGDVHTIFQNPRHPYTIGLMDSLPKLTEDEDWLRPIPGQPPSLINRPPGCAFHPRCFLSQGRLPCREEEPPLRAIDGGAGHRTACHFAEELVGRHSKFAAPVGAGEGS